MNEEATTEQLWEKIEAITRLVNKACLKLKMSSFPKDSEVADEIISELMKIRRK